MDSKEQDLGELEVAGLSQDLSPLCARGQHRWSWITIGGNEVCLRYGCPAERACRRRTG